MNQDNDSALPSLLPDPLRRPHWLLWTWALPIAILLVLNYRAWWLAEGEMTPEQHELALLWGLFNLGNLLAALLCTGWLKWKKIPVNWPVGTVLLALQCAYIWFCTIKAGAVTPAEVRVWIFPTDRLLFQQWTWAMPPAFYACLVLAGFPLRKKRSSEAGLSALAIVLGPVVIYFIGLASSWFRPSSGSVIAGQIFVVLFIGATLLLGLGLIRLLLILFSTWLKGGKWAHAGLVLLFALVMPLAGLTLNKQIHFPADYQGAWVYIMTVVNALLLLVPAGKNRWGNLALLLGRCLLFPFTLYFFLVFLPYLPLSIPAILAVGSGFLILTPTVLFIVHLMRLREVWVARLPVGRWPAAGLGLVAFAIIPGFITVQAWQLGRQLERGLDWVYAPNTASQAPFNGSPESVVKACDWLRDYKNGRYLPYLTSYRAWLMFDGLVLPDDKLERIYEAFSGKDFDEGASFKTHGFDLFNFRGTNRDVRRPIRARPPNRQVALEQLTAETKVADGIAKTVIRLDIRPETDAWQSEYLTRFTLPEGAVVSGFWLHIGGERVPGRLFEKKAALWVYRMIRDVTRRDPGLLFYTGPNELQLQVFPLAKDETRTVEFELTYPEGLARSIEIDGQKAPLGDIQRVAMVTATDAGPVVVLNKPALDELPLIQRKPYWHFIVDWSEGSQSHEEMIASIQQLTQISGLEYDFTTTLANFDSIVLHQRFLLDSAPQRLDPILLRKFLQREGGFLPARAIMQSLVSYEQEYLQADAEYDRYPIFVLLTNKKVKPWPDDLRPFTVWTPEAPGVLVATPDGVTALDWQGKPMELPPADLVPPVGVLALGESVQPVLYGPWTAKLDFTDGGELRFLESEGRTFVPLGDVTALTATNDYGQGLALQAASLAVERDPARETEALPSLVAASKETGVLIPQTSYIVVENSAQWRMLERTEKEKLEANSELELMETPEPAVWILGALLLAFEAARRRLFGHPWLNRPQKRFPA